MEALVYLREHNTDDAGRRLRKNHEGPREVPHHACVERTDVTLNGLYEAKKKSRDGGVS